MQSGVPVIVSDRASLPEVVGEAATILPAEDPKAWVLAISRSLEDEALRAKMADSGLKRSTIFSWQRCAKETIDAYEVVAKMNQ
jgi:alpha-1,3-rhamnosyl/mannosyltransferase